MHLEIDHIQQSLNNLRETHNGNVIKYNKSIKNLDIRLNDLYKNSNSNVNIYNNLIKNLEKDVVCLNSTDNELSKKSLDSYEYLAHLIKDLMVAILDLQKKLELYENKNK